jgi:hypothetical protein
MPADQRTVIKIQSPTAQLGESYVDKLAAVPEDLLVSADEFLYGEELDLSPQDPGGAGASRTGSAQAPGRGSSCVGSGGSITLSMHVAPEAK